MAKSFGKITISFKLVGSVVNTIARLPPPASRVHTYQRQPLREKKGSQLIFNQAM